MIKKAASVLLFLVLGAVTWYFFIKPSDYIIRFKANTFPGAINQTIKAYHNLQETSGEVVQKDLYHLENRFIFGDSTHQYTWKIEPLTDSTSKIRVGIKDADHSLMNKIKIPFTETAIKKRSIKNLLEFKEVLKEHINNFKVTIIGEDKIQPTYCAYIPVKGKVGSKAKGMMQHYSYLSSVLLKNKVELNGLPFVEVTHWNMDNDSIHYNFCYPIIRSEKLPTARDIHYKKIFGKKALKAIYNGNYITSDRAWFALLHYADKHNIAVEPKPIEFFFNNPNMGGNELTWHADVYLPIKSDETL